MPLPCCLVGCWFIMLLLFSYLQAVHLFYVLRAPSKSRYFCVRAIRYFDQETLIHASMQPRYQQDTYLAVATKAAHLPASERPPEDTPFSPKAFIIRNSPELATVLLSAPTEPLRLVDTPPFDYGTVLRDCLFVLSDHPDSAALKESWAH